MHSSADHPDLDILFDMRCLQDPAFAARGIGRHALNIVRHARIASGRLQQARLVGLIDPRLPALPHDTRALLETVRTTPYVGSMMRPVCFVQLSPMTHDPIYTARLLHDEKMLRAAVIYDFIPYDFPEQYLPNTQSRVDYHISLRWLARSDLYLPISHGVGQRLRDILNVPPADIVTTGAPLDAAFELSAADVGSSGRHILVIGGADRRKNVECAVRAHAAAVALQVSKIPLVITGNYPDAWIRDLHRLAAGFGASEQLIQVPGHVTQESLLALYRDAIAVVVPSRAEGFSLPVVEAMASGVPVLASEIPAHVELINDRSQLFPPDDDRVLSQALVRLAADAEWRDGIVAGQAAIWPRFRADAVALRFWSAVERRLGGSRALHAPAVTLGRRPRVALLSPVPPARSGIADHTAATCAELGRRVDLHVFTDTERPLPLRGAATVRPLSALPLLSSDFDRVVGVMGNSEFHVGIFNLLHRYGGAVIAHDARLLGFYCGMLGMDRAAQQAGRELRRSVTHGELERWLADENSLELLFLGEICDSAEPLCVHSAVTARLIATQYGTKAVHLPFCAYREWDPEALLPVARRAARDRLGIATDQVAISTFGFVHTTKAPEDCIWALDILRHWQIDAHLYFIGQCMMDLDPLRRLAVTLGVDHQVHFVGDFLDEATYRDYLLATDVGLQFRLFGLGSISGALSDCIAAGLPTVANDDLASALDAPVYVARVPDRISPVLVAEAIADLFERGGSIRTTEPARLAYQAEHNLGTYSDRLCEAMGLKVSPKPC